MNRFAMLLIVLSLGCAPAIAAAQCASCGESCGGGYSSGYSAGYSSGCGGFSGGYSSFPSSGYVVSSSPVYYDTGYVAGSCSAPVTYSSGCHGGATTYDRAETSYRRSAPKSGGRATGEFRDPPPEAVGAVLRGREEALAADAPRAPSPYPCDWNEVAAAQRATDRAYKARRAADATKLAAR